MAVHVRDDLRTLAPYTPGMNAAQAAARFGVAVPDVVKLGSGENPFGPSPAAVAAVSGALGRLHEYPEWTSRELRYAVALHMGVDEAQVVCGAGETEIISGLIRAFSREGDEIAMHRTTFPIYHLYAEAEGRRPVFADAGDAPVMAVEDLIARLTERTRLVFLTSPHNPSGRVVPLDAVRRVCAAAPQAVVVVDEAYIHFSGQEPALGLLAEFDNLVVLRTFSKAYGLAGLRVGFGIARTEIVDALLRIKPTWNLGPLQVAGAVAALGDGEHVARTTQAIRRMRSWTAKEIDRLPGAAVVAGSEANFLLVRLEQDGITSTDMFGELAARGLIVKDCSQSYLGLGDRHIRIDIGLEPVMARLVQALREVLS